MIYVFAHVSSHLSKCSHDGAFPSLDSYNMGMLVSSLNSITFQTTEVNDKLCKIESTNEQVQITFVQNS